MDWAKTAARSGRRRAGLLAGLAALGLLAVLAPAQAAAQDDLLGQSPMCGDDCSQSGVSWTRYELSHYGIDNWIDLTDEAGVGPMSVDVPKFENLIPSAIQSVSAIVWQGALLVVNGALVLLEWAFSLALTEEAMPELSQALLDLHRNVLGTPWFLAAIAVAGLWGLWNGLVRLRTIQTLTGLLATVLLMAAALFVINRPQETVGEFSQLANDSALGVIGLGAAGTTSGGEESWRGASGKLFNLVVLQPWCALQFEQVSFCHEDDPTRDGDEKVRDAWLKHPAWQKEKDDNGEEEREEVYNRFKDSDDVPNARVHLQEAGGAFERLGVLALILVGVLGAVCLFLWLGLKLVIAGVMVLFLTLATPVMLLAPAFGEAGRKAFGTWAKRLGGAIIAKLVYALFLALVIFVANLISGLDSLNWGGQWVILIVFWWGVLLKRKELVGFATGDAGGGAMGGLGLLKAYLGYRAVRDVGGSAVRGATYLPRKAAGATGRATRGMMRWRRHPQRHARQEAAQRSIKEDLRGQARQQAEHDRTNAKGVLGREEQWRRYETNRGPKGKPAGPKPTVARPNSAEVQHARSVVARHGVNGNIAIRDADIERFVRESGDPQIEERYEQSQRQGYARGEVKAEKRRDKTEFKRHVKHERRRYRREQRVDRSRRKVYR